MQIFPVKRLQEKRTVSRKVLNWKHAWLAMKNVYRPVYLN